MNDPLRYAKPYGEYLIAPRMGRFDVYGKDREEWVIFAGMVGFPTITKAKDAIDLYNLGYNAK